MRSKCIKPSETLLVETEEATAVSALGDHKMSALCLQSVSRRPGVRKVSRADEHRVTVSVIRSLDLLQWYESLLTFWENIYVENVQ